MRKNYCPPGQIQTRQSQHCRVCAEYSLKELQGFARFLKVSATGTKAGLCDRILQNIETKGRQGQETMELEQEVIDVLLQWGLTPEKLAQNEMRELLLRQAKEYVEDKKQQKKKQENEELWFGRTAAIERQREWSEEIREQWRSGIPLVSGPPPLYMPPLPKKFKCQGYWSKKGPYRTTKGSNVITVSLPGRNRPGDRVQLFDAVGFNGIPAREFNQVHEIIDAIEGYIKIRVPTKAMASGWGGSKGWRPIRSKKKWPGKSDWIRKALQVEQYLRNIGQIDRFRGPAFSRIDDTPIGGSEYFDKTPHICWPEGYVEHYIGLYNVMPSKKYYDYINRKHAQLDTEGLISDVD